ncbi:MAG: hypothetical protein H7Y12_01955 [Sphingobacteriaceae bacterium]|nr:hypothetical protein [Cytophagaceae bacterium]
MSFEEVIRYVSTASILLPASLSLFRLRPMLSRYPALLGYLGVTVVVEGCGTVLLLQGARDTTQVYALYPIFEFGLLSLLYYKAVPDRAFQWMILALNALFIPLVLYRLQTVTASWDGLLYVFENIPLVLLALLFFYRLLNTLEATNLFRFPMFWFSTGILIYFSGTLFVYMFSSYIVTAENYLTLRDLWSLTTYLNIVFHLVLSVGIWHTR